MLAHFVAQVGVWVMQESADALSLGHVLHPAAIGALSLKIHLCVRCC